MEIDLASPERYLAFGETWGANIATVCKDRAYRENIRTNTTQGKQLAVEGGQAVS